MGFGNFAGGMASGLNTGIRTGTLMNESKRRDELVGLEITSRKMALEKEESARDAERRMNEAGYTVFKAYEQTQGAPMGAGPESGPEYSGSSMGGQGATPPFELMTKVADARTYAAMDAKRPDLAFAEAQKGFALREANIGRVFNEANQKFAISGDLNAYAEAVNKVYPGTELQIVQNPDGSVMASGKFAGKPFQQKIEGKDVPAYVAKLQDPKTAHAITQQMFMERFKSGLKREEEAAKPVIVPSGAKLVRPGQPTIENPRDDQFQPIEETDEDGNKRYGGAFNKRTGQVTPAPGLGGPAAAPQPGYNRKDLGGEKEIVDVMKMHPELATRDQVSGAPAFTEQGQKALPLASGARTYGRGPNGEKLQPAAAVDLARRVIAGKAEAKIAIKKGEDGKTYRVPVILDGKREVQIGPMQEITGEVAARTRADQEDAARDIEGAAGAGPRTLGLGTNRVSGQIR